MAALGRADVIGDGFAGEVAGDKVGAVGHGAGMRWVLMLFVILAAVMGGEAWAVLVMGRAVAVERVGEAEATRLGGRAGDQTERGDADGAGELAAGEELPAWRGETVAVLANLPEADTATWNLEVENEHVYRVGPAGILVHNTCPTPKELFEGGGSGPANNGFRGGAHTNVQAPGIESHHMPAKSVSGLGEPNGPAIQMTPADHARTMSNGKMQGSGEYREMIGDMISGGDMRGAMATEIRDVRRVAREAGDPRRYNGAMREMMDYSRGQGYIPKNPQTVVPRTR